MLDEETAAEMKIDPSDAIESKNNWQNFLIYAAGPLANIILAILITAGFYITGEVGQKPIIGKVRDLSVAQQVGITEGDEIASINGKNTPLWKDAQTAIGNAVIDGKAIAVEMTNGKKKVIAAQKIVPADLETGLFQTLGFSPNDIYLSPELSAVAAGSGADVAGIMPGDIIVAIDERVVDYWSDVSDSVRDRPGETVEVLLFREQQALTVTATLGDVRTGGRRIGRLGVSPSVRMSLLIANQKTVRMGVITALERAIRKGGGDILRTFSFIGHVIAGNLSSDSVGGPILIADMAGKAAQYGLSAWLHFVAAISVGLAVVNLLPLPVLDGGRMLICVIQFVIRRRLPKTVLWYSDRLGMFLVLLLMFTVIANDIFRYI